MPVAEINIDARELLQALQGRTIMTVSGRPNTILALNDDQVLVGTERSPKGASIPMAWIQDAVDRLSADGEVERKERSEPNRHLKPLRVHDRLMAPIDKGSGSPERGANNKGWPPPFGVP